MELVHPSLPCLLCFSPRDIDSILDAGDIESDGYEEESLSDQCGKDDLEDKSAVVYVSFLLGLFQSLVKAA